MLNRVILIGRLTRDPDLRYTPSNVATSTFTVAVDRGFLNQNGEREADFINVVTWRKQAENVKKYIGKGSLVSVEGRIQTRNYTSQDGRKVYVTEVIADNVRFLESKGSRAATNGMAMDQPAGYDMDIAPNVPSTNIEEDPYMDFGSNIEITDDLPF